MWLKSLMTCVASFCVVVTIQTAVAAQPTNPCDLPPGLSDELSRKYPGTHVVSLGDLSKENRQSFQKDHGKRCPGLVRVNFYGDGSPTLAFVLVAGTGAKEKSYLMVAQLVGTIWKVRMLDTDDGAPTPVVWVQPAGKYRDVDRGKEIQATRPVIVFAGYEAFAIVYAWTGTSVSKVWIAD